MMYTTPMDPHWFLRQEEKTLLERLEGRWVRRDGQEMGEVVGSQGMLRWSKVLVSGESGGYLVGGFGTFFIIIDYY